MASLCKRQQCTIERRGFRQELDSWRHKLIHCVGKLSCHCVCASVCRRPGGRRAPGRRSFCVLLPPRSRCGATEPRLWPCSPERNRRLPSGCHFYFLRSVLRGCCLALPPSPRPPTRHMRKIFSSKLVRVCAADRRCLTCARCARDRPADFLFLV